MTQERKERIARLLDRVEETAQSPANQARLKREPKVLFQLEEPIASSILWGFDVNDYIGDPYLYVEQQLTTRLWRWENFPDDDAPMSLDLAAWLGHYPEFTYAGMEVAFTPRGVPILQTDHPLTRDPDLRLLRPVDFYRSGWMPRVLRWYDDLRAIVGERLKVNFNMTWWRGCLDLAIQLRGYDQFIADTAERPEFVHDLLRFLTEQRCRWYEAYYRHYGLPVTPTYAADDWINVPFISPRIFAEFVLPRYLEIERFHGGIAGIHSCGNQAPVQRYLLQLQTLPALEVSPWTDLQTSLNNIPASKRLFVALHPNDVLCATPAEMEARLQFITTSCRGREYGIGTSGLTPIWDDPQEYVQRIRTWTSVVQRVMAPLRTS